MNNFKDFKNKSRLLELILSIFIILSGICLIVACIHIYSLSDNPFTRPVVINHLKYIAVPLIITLLLTVFSGIMSVIAPSEQQINKLKPHSFLLKLMYERKDFDNCDIETKNLINRQQITRRKLCIIRAILIIVGTIAFFVYALNINNYSSDVADPDAINNSVIKAMYILLPILVVIFTYSIYTAYYIQNSMTKELELLKSLTNTGTKPTNDTATKNDNHILILRYIILVAGLILFIYGLANGGVSDVLTKAVNICTECIGLG